MQRYKRNSERTTAPPRIRPHIEVEWAQCDCVSPLAADRADTPSQKMSGSISRRTDVLSVLVATLAIQILALSTWTAAHAQAATASFFIRSHKADGTFHGYHEILREKRPGFVEVRYCDQTFYVRPTTVLWTEREAEAGRQMAVELNRADDREILCTTPEAQVQLEDLGMKKARIRELRGNNEPLNMRSSRMHVIRDAFKGFK